MDMLKERSQFNSESKDKFPVPNTELYWEPGGNHWYSARKWEEGFAFPIHKDPTVKFYLPTPDCDPDHVLHDNNGNFRRIYQLRKSDGAWLEAGVDPYSCCNLGEGLSCRLDALLVKSIFDLSDSFGAKDSKRIEEANLMVKKILKRDLN